MGKQFTVDSLRNLLAQISNTYYDRQMAEAMRRARDDIAAVYRRYLQDCYEAGRRIEEDKES